MTNLTKLLMLIMVIGVNTSLFAATKTFSGSGNWSATARWSGGSLPLSTDDVVISSGADCTFDVGSATCASLSVDVFLFSVGSINIGANTLNVTGAVSGPGTIIMGAGTLNIGGSNTHSGTFTPGTGTVNYNGAAQTIRATSYYNLQLSNAGTKTAGGAISAANTFIIGAGTIFAAANNQVTRSGAGTLAVTVNGTYQTTNTQGLTGSTTTAISNANTTVALGNASTVEYSGAAQTVSARTDYAFITISGSGIKTAGGTVSASQDVNITAGTLAVVANTVSVAGSLLGAGAISFTTGTLNLGGNYSNSGAITLGTTSTIHYNGTSAQSVRATTYANLSFSNAGVKTFAGAVAITAGRTLLINSGGIVEAGANQVTATGATATITINGTFRTADLDGFSGSAVTAINSTNTTISAFTSTSNIVYNASSGTQVVTAALLPYGSLTLSNSGSRKQVAANLTMLPGTVFTLDQNVYFDMGTRNIQNSAGTGNVTFNVNGIFYTRLQAGFSGGATAINATATTINLGAASVIYYGRTSDQTLSARSDYAIVRIDGNSNKTMDGNTTVNDSLSITDGAVIIGTNTLTLNGRAGGSGTITGSSTSNIAVGGTTGNVTVKLTPTSAATKSLNDLSYNRAGQQVQLADSVYITGTITPAAGTLVTGGKLKLVSNASGTARIAQGSGTYITGDVIAERYIPAVARRYRFLASTITNATLLDWQNEIFVTGAGTGTTVGTLNSNGFDATLTNVPTVYEYNETLPGNLDAGFMGVTNSSSSLASVPLPAGKGYRVFIRGDRSTLNRLNGLDNTQNEVTLNLIGPVNTGNITMPVTYTSTGAAADDGWNLLGNAYPSNYDWDAYYDAAANYSNITSTIYIYDPNTNSYKSFNATSNTGTLTNGIIPAGASFFIKADDSPSMTFVETYKTNAAPTALFKTDAAPFSIRVLSDDGSEDELIVRYMEGAKRTYDAADILKLDAPYINLSAVTPDHKKLSADCRELPVSEDRIPLDIQVAKSGTYTFVLPDPALLITGKAVLLADHFTGTITDLSTESNYSFTVSTDDPASQGSQRFELLIGAGTTKAEELMQEEKALYDLKLCPVLVQDEVVISSARGLNGSAVVNVMDAGGRSVRAVQRLGWSNSKITVDMSGISAGIYFIAVSDPASAKMQVLRCVKQ